MKWSKKEVNFVQKFYKNTPNRVLSHALNRSRSAVNHKGIDLGLWKSMTVDNSSYGLRSNAGRKSDMSRATKGL